MERPPSKDSHVVNLPPWGWARLERWRPLRNRRLRQEPHPDIAGGERGGGASSREREALGLALRGERVALERHAALPLSAAQRVRGQAPYAFRVLFRHLALRLRTMGITTFENIRSTPRTPPRVLNFLAPSPYAGTSPICSCTSPNIFSMP